MGYKWKRWKQILKFRNRPSEVFFGKGVLKICSKFTGEHPCRSAIFEITLRHGCSPVYLLHIFWTPFLKNTYGELLLKINEMIILFLDMITLAIVNAFCNQLSLKIEAQILVWKSIDFLHCRIKKITKVSKLHFYVLITSI